MSKKSVVGKTTVTVTGDGINLQYDVGGFNNASAPPPITGFTLAVGYNVIIIPVGTQTIMVVPPTDSAVQKYVVDSGGPGISFAANRPVMWGVPDGYKNYFYIYSYGVELVTICFL